MPPIALILSGLLAQPMLAALPPDTEAHESTASPSWLPPTLHTLTLFTVVRGAEAVLWPEPFADTDPKVWGRNYRIAFTEWPVFDKDQPAFSWDGDRWEINVIGHGLMGSELYLRSRQCRFGWAGALAFTTASSFVWEYGFEANGVRPSAQDLAFTPIAGLLFGEARYLLWNSAANVRHPAFRTLLRTVIDPFGELERGIHLFDC